MAQSISNPIAFLAEQLNYALVAAHARQTLTPEQLVALSELQANLFVVLPAQPWHDAYLKDNR